MSKNKSRLKDIQDQLEILISKTNEKIGDLGEQTENIYNNLNDLQKLFETIRNVPSEKRLEYERLKRVRLNWKKQAEKIESDYKNATVKNAGKGAVGISTGVAVVALGPTAAMGVATTFGVASTGTAISSLGGAAATNAALAWLGGGALAAGGGGMAAGNALLALAGPIGWTIAGLAFLSSCFFLIKGKKERDRLLDIFTLIGERDKTSYELAMIELNERISRIIDESRKLKVSIERIANFGVDYNLMTEAQQYELGAYVNLMNSSTQLLVNPILGLQPKYNVEDLNRYMADSKDQVDEKKQGVIISLANLLFKIDLEEKDRTILHKTFKSNKEFLISIDMSKKEFDLSILGAVNGALINKYRTIENNHGDAIVHENLTEPA